MEPKMKSGRSEALLDLIGELLVLREAHATVIAELHDQVLDREEVIESLQGRLNDALEFLEEKDNEIARLRQTIHLLSDKTNVPPEQENSKKGKKLLRKLQSERPNERLAKSLKRQDAE